jgi:hypothetical protein
MGLGIHGAFLLTDPQAYVEFARSAPIPLYRDIGLALTQPDPRLFGVVMLVLETAAAALILGRGRFVTAGLLGAIAFLLAIAPLGVEEWPNVVLAAGMAVLLRQTFPIDALTLLRNRLRGRVRTATGSRR